MKHSATPAPRCPRRCRDINRKTPHLTEPTAPCDLIRIEERVHLVGRCPSCGVKVAHEPSSNQTIKEFSRRTCGCCGLPYWITSGDDMPPPRSLTSRPRRTTTRTIVVPSPKTTTRRRKS